MEAELWFQKACGRSARGAEREGAGARKVLARAGSRVSCQAPWGLGCGRPVVVTRRRSCLRPGGGAASNKQFTR